MPPPGFDVDPRKLDEAATSMDGLATDISGARDKLLNDGGLPTLDPLSKAMGAVSAIAGGVIGPLVAPLAALAGMAISEEIDPYPPIRQAWLDALERYRKLVADDAKRLRETANAYRGTEEGNKVTVDRVYPTPVPMPTIPGSPTAPMPTVPGEPTVPMPPVRPGAGPDGPVSI
jgi:hypothetical protein